MLAFVHNAAILYFQPSKKMETEDTNQPNESRFECSLCGGRDWPTSNTSCPLCYEAEEGDPLDEWGEDIFEKHFVAGWKCAASGGSVKDCPDGGTLKEREAWMEGYEEGILDTQCNE